MELIKLWAQAAAADLLDANKLADIACRMAYLGNCPAAREFAERSRTHLGYVKDAQNEIDKIIRNISTDCENAESKIQAMRLAAFEEERGIGIQIIESRLESL